MIFIVYLSQYYIYKNSFYRVLLSFGLIKCSSNSDISTDEVQYSQHWELEYIVDHYTRCDGIIRYLVRWKGYGLWEDS